MRTWKEVIKEATAAEINKAGAKALRDERNKNKAEKTTKGKSAYQNYLDDQLAFKKEKYEAQKAAQLEKIRQGKVQKQLAAAKQSLANIKTTPISSKDGDGTAYSDLIGNVGSAVGGVSGAAFHGIRALAAKRKADKEAKAAENNQPEMKPKGKSGRPPGGGPTPGTSVTAPEPQASSVFKKPVAKMPTLGNDPIGQQAKMIKNAKASRDLKNRAGNVPTIGNVPIGQQAKRIKNAKAGPLRGPAVRIGKLNYPLNRLSSELIKANEEYSNWREELLIEVDEKDKGKKEKIIDVMKGKNTIIINPEDKKVNEESAAWQRKEGKNPEGGLNAKGIASYRRANPGSKLSLAVTTPPSKLDPDSKSAKRRKSFCARMGGVDGPMKDEKGRPTRKALALRKWNC